MTIERARVRSQAKPWGLADLRPWSDLRLWSDTGSDTGDGAALIGELSYERTDVTAPATTLLLKLLFTSAPLSIQVHPDDAYAKSIGQPNGKSEAWHVLRAAPGAKVALGLKQPITREQLRHAIDDGSIATLVDWQPVQAHDTISVPAGTIHAIGAGVVVAEIQQRSDTTFRLFDHGSVRALHVDDATAMADLGMAQSQPRCERLSAERTLLASNSHFVFERIALQPDTAWHLDATRETWLLVLDGVAHAGSFDLTQGEALFAQHERVEIGVGRIGLDCLVAYTGSGGPAAQLLQRIELRNANDESLTGNQPAPALPIGGAP